MTTEHFGLDGKEQQWSQDDNDLMFHKQCPLTLLLKSVPHSLDDLLELYYHCKLCSTPQAYIELETFVEHVQEFHPDYYQSPSTIVLYPEAKTASSQTTEDHNTQKQEQNVKPEKDEDSSPDKSKTDSTLSSTEEAEFELPVLEQCTTIKPPEIKQKIRAQDQSKTTPKTLKQTSTRSLLRVDAAAVAQEQTIPETLKPGNLEPFQTENIKKEKIQESDNDSDQMLLTVEGGSGEQVQQTSDDTEQEVNDWEDSQEEESLQTIKQEGFDGALRKSNSPPQCKKCYQYYNFRHHESCQRAHSSEKPSCSAYVCVADKNQEVFTCRFCGRMFLTDVLLKNHISSHLDELKGECDLCSKKFDSQRRLLSHIRQCRRRESNTTCKHCLKEFPTEKVMLKHELQVHLARGSHICEICGRTFNRRSNLQTHLRFHSSERPFACKECPMSFKAKSNLIRHRMRHTGVRPHMCEVCGRSFSDKTSLKRHSFIHTEAYAKKLHYCKYCNAALKSESLLMKHIQRVHKEEEPNAGYSCDVCNKVFRERHNMQAHKMIHTGERPFECKICGKRFRKNPDLTIHSRVHTGVKPFKCEFCDMACTTNSNLQKHRMSHTGERPHQCKICQRRFIDKAHLNRHHLTHTGVKPHVCPTCERGFATKAQCQQHMLIHTGEKPFICGACGKTFRQKAKAQKHRCIWKVIQKPGVPEPQYIYDNQAENVFVQMGEGVNAHGENQIAVRVLDPNAGHTAADHIGYQIVEPEQQGNEQVAYHIIESTGENGSEQIAVRVVDPATVGNEQVAYQIVGEAANSEELSQVAVQVLEQAARQGGEQVAYQVVDEEGNELGIHYGDQAVETG